MRPLLVMLLAHIAAGCSQPNTGAQEGRSPEGMALEVPDLAMRCVELNNAAVQAFLYVHDDSVMARDSSIAPLEAAADLCPTDTIVYINLLNFLTFLQWNEEADTYARRWHTNNNGDSLMLLWRDEFQRHRDSLGAHDHEGWIED